MTGHADDEILRDLLERAAYRADPPSDGLVSRGVYDRLAGRRRKRRQAATAGAVVLVLGLAVAMVMPKTTGGGKLAVAPAATATPSSPASPTASPTPEATYDNASSPKNPELGVPYNFNLLTHCAVEYLVFGGRVWRATSPIKDSRLADWPTPMALVTITLSDSKTLILKESHHEPMEFKVSQDELPLCG